MIAALAAWQTTDEPQSTAPAPQAANPLRRGETVQCPACGAEGEAWRWELDRPPRFQEWTTAAYKCRACKHVFALREPVPPAAGA